MENVEKLRVLSNDEVLKVHENTLKVLENTGVYVFSEEVLKTFSEIGLNTDINSKIVKFPRKIVEKALLSIPEEIKLFNRKGDISAELGKGKGYAASG